jgi:hypothetical protein
MVVAVSVAVPVTLAVGAREGTGPAVTVTTMPAAVHFTSLSFEKEVPGT